MSESAKPQTGDTEPVKAKAPAEPSGDAKAAADEPAADAPSGDA
eukprot:CAMPEP_0114658320 /NCGR_PEP_ID=MMETSP0191-20121206/15559_1 /TAXON_ID=126664 /ORGANISM="Sorites sp." /LENGTH=43 /DNA_ID= /DNA_START= /DNA_END= /DNA_ORIENTATION=